jgi:hypothetical protein
MLAVPYFFCVAVAVAVAERERERERERPLLSFCEHAGCRV